MAAEQQPAVLLSCHFATQSFSGSLFSRRQQSKLQLGVNQQLRFTLAQTTRSRSAAFASITAGRQHAPTWQPLSLLSRLSDSAGSSSDIGSSEGPTTSGSRAGSSSSGYESSSDATTQDYSSSEISLDKINCQLCTRPLSQQGGNTKKRGFFGRHSSTKTPKPRGSTRFLVCDCCQRCYHELCCAEKGLNTAEGAGGVWYHSNECRQCQHGLQEQVSRGRCALSDGRSWQLIDCAPISTQDQGGLKALQALKRNLGDVLEVLLPQYGPGVAQQLVDTTKGYAILLRGDDKPVTAGLLDVYGQELAVLDVVSTIMPEQGKGHCTAMLGALEGWLGPGLGVASLMAVCPENEQHTLDLWQQKFGFKRISPKQLKQLQSSLPAIGCYQEAVLLSKALASKQQQSASQQGSVKQLQLPIKQLHVQEQQDSKQHQQSSQSATSGR